MMKIAGTTPLFRPPADQKGKYYFCK